MIVLNSNMTVINNEVMMQVEDELQHLISKELEFPCIKI